MNWAQLRKSEQCKAGDCSRCGGGLIRGGGTCECWCHQRRKPKAAKGKPK